MRKAWRVRSVTCTSGLSPGQLPLTLPRNLDKEAPPGAVHLNLRGPGGDGDNCEWWDTGIEQYLTYQNFILWDWDRNAEPPGGLVDLGGR